MACFITFEGIEGCGKSTQLQMLAQLLTDQGRSVTVTREPGGCPIADQVRSILLDAGNHAMTPLAELLLYAAARAQHMTEVVLPALRAGRIVLCDRFTDATAAYQGYGRQLDMTVIRQLNQLATTGVAPQLTILLDCPVEIGLERAMARINSSCGAREERFEMEALSFHRRVREGYLTLAAKEPERFVIIDSTTSVRQSAADVASAVLPRLARDNH